MILWTSTLCYVHNVDAVNKDDTNCTSALYCHTSLRAVLQGGGRLLNDLPGPLEKLLPEHKYDIQNLNHNVKKRIYSRFTYYTTSSARTSRGRKFQRKKTISQRKNLPIECAQGDRPARCPNHFFAVNEPSAVPWWWCFVLWSEVFWCLDVCCGVRSCDGHVIWCDVVACVVSCHVMQCDVMVMSCTTPVLLCTTKYYSSITLFYKVLLQYYSSTTLYYKVLLQYYPVLQSTTPVLLCTTKYYSNTTLNYKVLLQYYSVLQSTTPVLLCTTQYYSSTTPSSTTLYYKVLLQY